MSVYTAAGFVQGMTNVAEYERGRPLREQQLAEATARRQLAEQELQSYQAVQPAQQELELAQLRQQTRQANSANLRNLTYDAFRRYDADSDVRHLNTFIQEAKRNPVGANTYGTTVRIDAVSPSTETDKLLRQAGYQSPEEVYNNPDLAQNLVISTMQDGTRQLVSMENLHAATGYNNFLTDQELKQKETKARIDQLVRGGQQYAQVQQREKVVQSLMEAEGIPLHEAYQQVMQMEKGQRGSTDDRAIRQIMEEEGIGFLDAADKYYAAKKQGGTKTDKERYVDRYLAENPEATPLEAEEAYAARIPTSTQKEIVDVEEVKASLDKMDYFNIDIGKLDTAERAKVHGAISKIEDLRGVKLSTEDKRLARDFRSLRNLGQTVTDEVTPQETGLLDSTLNRFKNYLVNEVGGKVGTSSYETFRGIFRNALYGASLTDNEIKAFNAAAGTLGQKFKPAMAAFKTQLETIKSKMEAIRDQNDPYIAHYYFGTDIDNIDETIRQLESRLNLANQRLEAASPAVKVRVTPEPQQPGAPRRSLEDIYKESRQ